MRDKCLRNELMDVKSINLPDLDSKKIFFNETESYIYATYLKPGYHQLLIYDPTLDRIFCKDFVVNLNTREDIYPEFPILEGMKIKKRVKWIWRSWLQDQ